MPPDVVPFYNTREIEWVEVEEKINNMVGRIPFINHRLTEIDSNIEYDFSLEKMLIFGIVLGGAAGIGAFLMGFVDDKIGSKKTILLSMTLVMRK